MDSTKLQTRAAIFHGFTTAEIDQVRTLGVHATYAAGELIFREGDPGNYLNLVLDGSVSIHRGDKCLARCRAYEAFGEMGAFRHAPRSATARASTTVELLQLDEAALSRLLESPMAVRFLLNIINVLSARLEVGNTWIASSLEAQRGASQADSDA